MLCKKAAFLGKIALFISGLLGYGGIFSLGALGGGNLFGGGGGHHGHRPIFNDGIFGGGPIPLSDPQHENYPLSGGGYYKSEIRNQVVQPNTASSVATTVTDKVLLNDNFYNYEKKVLFQDRHSKLYEKEMENEDKLINLTPSIGYRSFAWKTN